MPIAPLRRCSGPRCPALVPRGKCPDCARVAEQRRGSNTERGYGSRWRRLYRNPHLRAFPLCGGKRPDAYLSTASVCAREGLTRVATNVHHILGHAGPESDRFRDPRNYESLCASCHAKVIDRGEFGR